MEEKDINKKSKGKTITIVILVLVIIGMALYIAYDKGVFNSFLSKKDTKEEKKEEVKEDKSNTYTISFKEEEKEYKNEEGKTVVKNKRNLPVITSTTNQTSADKIVTYLTDISDKEWNELDSNDNKETYASIPSSYNETYGISYLFSLSKQTDNYISIKQITSGSLGGVSWNGDIGYTFNKETGEVIKLKDMVKDYDSFITFAYNECIDYISKQDYANTLWNDNTNGNWKDIVKKTLSKDGCYYFNETGLRFTFESYLIGSSSMVHTVDISYDKLTDYLNDYYKN